MKNDWYRFVGMLVIALIMMGGVATAIPWASKTDVLEIQRYNNQFSERMARMEANQANIIEDIREIKQLIMRGR